MFICVYTHNLSHCCVKPSCPSKTHVWCTGHLSLIRETKKTKHNPHSRLLVMLSARPVTSPPPFNRAVSHLSLAPSSSENISDIPFSAHFVSTIVRGWQTPATTTNRKKSVPKRILSYLAYEDIKQRLQVFIVTEVAAEGRRGLAASVHNLQQEQGR